MRKIDYIIYDSEASISHTRQDIECYQEHIDMLRQGIKDKTIDSIQGEKGIKDMQKDRELDKWFLELQLAFHDELLKKLRTIRPTS